MYKPMHRVRSAWCFNAAQIYRDLEIPGFEQASPHGGTREPRYRIIPSGGILKWCSPRGPGADTTIVRDDRCRSIELEMRMTDERIIDEGE